MKIISKIILVLTIIATFGISTQSASATMQPMYPTWGYNTKDHICQIKQEAQDSVVNEALSGAYQDMRECRFKNPEIIFYTGRGIIIWLMIFISSFILHQIIFPKFEKRSKADKTLFFLQDITGIWLILFFIVLLQHYFNVPSAVYPYTSDIDNIFYSTFIRGQVPMYFATGYLIVTLVRLIHVHQKHAHSTGIDKRVEQGVK